jgi:hypothetical protein
MLLTAYILRTFRSECGRSVWCIQCMRRLKQAFWGICGVAQSLIRAVWCCDAS